MGVGWNFQFQYPLPYNTTVITNYPPTLSRTTRDLLEPESGTISDRAMFYSSVESLLDRYSSILCKVTLLHFVI